MLTLTKKSLPLCDTAGRNVHASTNWMSVYTVVSFTISLEVWLCLDMKNKGQTLKGSHLTSHLSLKPSDTLCLVIKLPVNTIVDYRRVCAHAVALYIFRKRFCKRWIIHYFFLGFPWAGICTAQKKNTERNVGRWNFLNVYFAFVSNKNLPCLI